MLCYPICSMYGIFAYLWCNFLVFRKVNIPVPWGIWVYHSMDGSLSPNPHRSSRGRGAALGGPRALEQLEDGCYACDV